MTDWQPCFHCQGVPGRTDTRLWDNTAPMLKQRQIHWPDVEPTCASACVRATTHAVMRKYKTLSQCRVSVGLHMSAGQRRWANVVLMLDQRLQRWPDIKTALGYHIMLGGRRSAWQLHDEFLARFLKVTRWFRVLEWWRANNHFSVSSVKLRYTCSSHLILLLAPLCVYVGIFHDLYMIKCYYNCFDTRILWT